MEFHYKKRKLVFYIACLLLGIGILSIYLLNFNEIDWGDLSGFLLLVILLSAGIVGTLFYWRNLNTVVTVDDNGIYLTKNNITSVYVNWEEISKVDLTWLLEDYFLDALALLIPESSFFIYIYSVKNEVIKVGSELNEINKFISILKRRVGDRFDTRMIPYKYKLVKE